MGRLLAVLVFVGDVGIFVAARSPGSGALVAYALVAAVVAGCALRWPVAALIGALVVGAATGLGYLLLLWAAFRAGRSAVFRWGAVGVAAGGAGVPTVAAVADPGAAPQYVVAYLVFVALPLAAGCYLRQHDELLGALRRHNDALRRSSALLAERERLRERLRIARDMHDALGSRLSLVSMRAAAIEVGDAPAEHRAAVAELAGWVREATTELHEVVGALRESEAPGSEAPGSEALGLDEPGPGAPGLGALDALVDAHRRAGASVSLRRRGLADPVSAPIERAAYRVVEEGLTNASKHAPGLPVSVTLDREPDTLLVGVENPAPETSTTGRGFGLRGLEERVTSLGGLITARRDGTRFRLSAMFPTATAPPAAPGGNRRALVLGAATAVLLFAVLPAAMLVGAA